MNTRILTLSLILFLAAGSLLGQKKYTVQVGAFLDVKPQDFDPIRSLGFVYANVIDNNLYQVYIGGYEQQTQAETIASRLRSQGYANAQTVGLPLDQGSQVAVVQIATRFFNKSIEWERFEEMGTLYSILENDKVKVLTGIYSNIDAAKAALADIRKSGYSDAFAKMVNSKELIPITSFETGLKKPLIPLNLNRKPPQDQVQQTNQPPAGRQPVVINQPPRVQNRPADYGNVENTRILTPRGPGQPAYNDEPTNNTTVRTAPSIKSVSVPNIRGKVKRRSAMDLQTILKQKGYYASSLDGYYGNGTTQAYKKAIAEDTDLKKYQLLADNVPLPTTASATNRLQGAINTLWQDPNAPIVVESSTGAIALAYQAYLLFYNFGPSADVNSKMNGAIKMAYRDVSRRDVSFDFRSTYAYQDLDQLIQHLHYIHAAPGNDYSLPCWLYQVHPNETASARAGLGDMEVKMQACDAFQQWDEIRLLQTIAFEMCGAEEHDPQQVSTAAAARAQLYLIDKPLNKEDAKIATAWHKEIWESIDRWAKTDPLHQRMSDALKISYFQSQVRLEDYYMDQGFKAEQAKDLALATLHTLVSIPLERFS